MNGFLSHYFDALDRALRCTVVTQKGGDAIATEQAVATIAALAREVHASGHKVMFIGNGGSAAICSHMAVDFTKNGGVRALSFNDGPTLTCLGNDYDFAEVFSRQIGFHARSGDMLVAISSSGRSPDILEGVAAAREIGCKVITLSGFSPDNPLRRLGDLNFHVPSDAYGFVEISHHVLCHAVVDSLGGWSETIEATPLPWLAAARLMPESVS